MKWFKHDTDAAQDAKLRRLIMKYGAVGYAVYFHCLELIAGDISETNITFSLEHDAEIIADNLRIHGDSTKSGSDIVSQIMSYMVELRLFEVSGDRIFCLKLLKRIDASMLAASSKMRPLIQAAKENYLKSHDLVMTESCYTRLDYTRLDKTRQEETRRDSASGDASRVVKLLGSEGNVKLSETEYQSLLDSYGKDKTDEMVEELSTYKAMTGKKYKRDYLAIRRWVAEKVLAKKQKEAILKPATREKLPRAEDDPDYIEFMKRYGGNDEGK